MNRETKYICYPFMEMDTWATDYEVMTDGLSSEIGFVASLNDNDIKKDLELITREILNINPMIRKPDKKIIEEAKTIFLDLYKKYNTKFESFFLPIGNTASCAISKLRFPCKQIIRLIYKNDNSQRNLLDIFHLLTNLFHLMYLKKTDTKIEFKSRTYK